MNLIQDPWIPVLARSGKFRFIAPWEVAENGADMAVALAASRPDFNGALIQFLIGLVQCTMAPQDELEWKAARRSPPTAGDVRAAFDTVSQFFEFGGEGARFMQDRTLGEADKPARVPVAGLLIDSPGESAERHNADLFIKRDRVEGLCHGCVALALFTLQTNAPAGGAGHRVSVRGGGPLTTIVLGDSLWETIWWNVLPASRPRRDVPPEHRFPWLAPTRTSEPRTGRGTTPLDADSAQVFWGMPRRIRLLFDPDQIGNCDLCGSSDSELVRHYWTRNYGTNYEGAWRHPLTPHYRQGAQGELLPVHGQPGGIGYRHWLGLVQSVDDENRHQEPAAVVTSYFNRVAELPEPPEVRLWAFGFDMDNMKARAWCQSTMPLTGLPPDLRDGFAKTVQGLIVGAQEVGNNLRQSVRNGLFAKPAGFDARGYVRWNLPPGFQTNKALFTAVVEQFWQATEPEFYRILSLLAERLQHAEADTPLRASWHRSLARQAETLFDLWVNSGDLGEGDPRRIVLARRDLGRWNHGQKVRGILRLAS